MVPDLFLLVLILSYVILTVSSLVSEWKIESERKRLGHRDEDTHASRNKEKSKEEAILNEM